MIGSVLASSAQSRGDVHFSGADSETVVVLILLKLELMCRDEIWWMFVWRLQLMGYRFEGQ